MSPWLVKALIVQYLAISAVSAYERRWPWAIYFIGAAVISVAVLAMGKGGSDV